MKKRVVAILLSTVLCVTCAVPMQASDFETDAVVLTEESGGILSAEEAESEAPVPEADLSVPETDPELPETAETDLALPETEEIIPETETSDEEEETPVQEEVSAPEEGSLTEEEILSGGTASEEEEIPTDAQEEAVPEEVFEEAPVESLPAEEAVTTDDFGAETPGTEEAVLPVNGETAIALGENEVLASSWEVRDLNGEVQYRLAENTEPEPVQARASAVDSSAFAPEEVALSEDEISPEEGSLPADDGFVPLAGLSADQPDTSKRNYYTSEDGIVHITTVDIDGSVLSEGDYFFDENGIMVTGEQLITAGTRGFSGKTDGVVYFTDSDAAVLRAGTAATAAATPVNSDLGTTKKNEWLWDASKQIFRYYDQNGASVSIKELRKQAKKDYFEINGARYILKDNGAPYVNDYPANVGTYYLAPAKNAGDIPGKMAVSKWVNLKLSGGDRWRYYGKDGKNTYTKITATKLDKTVNASINSDKTYLLNEKGFLYTKAVMVKAGNGAYYGCNAKSIVYQDKVVKYGKYRYYFTASGKRATWSAGWHRCKGASNRFYYFDNKEGRIKETKGWVKITESKGKYGWYFFPKNGNHYVSKWSGQRYFRASGKLASGYTVIKGTAYFFKISTETERYGQMYKSQLITKGKKTYYAKSNGKLAGSWVKIDGKYYCFSSKDHTMIKDSFVTGPDKKTHGYIDAAGVFTTGWVLVDDSKNLVKYLNPSGKGYLKNTAKVIDGVRYYFDSDGYRVSDLTKFNLKGKKDTILDNIHKGKYKYYLECEKINGVVTVYTGKDKKVPVRSIRTSVGNPISLTPNGTFTFWRAERWQLLWGPCWGQYGSIIAPTIFFHSIPGNTSGDIHSLWTSAYDILGKSASHGCLRVCVADAKWIYDKCSGCQIHIYDGQYQALETNKGPLGRKPLVRRTSNVDPTDPAVAGDKYY